MKVIRRSSTMSMDFHFIHASDEWYITAERDFRKKSDGDGYIQLENGVGMMRLFIEEV